MDSSGHIGIGFGAVFFACESGDDDDSGDDDFADDDTDEDDYLKYCMEVWEFFSECGWFLEDEEGNEIDIAEIIILCEAGDENFGNEDLIMCLVENFSGCEGSIDCLEKYSDYI